MSRYSYGRRSMERLQTCNLSIQRVFYSVIEAGIMDVSIVEGVRSKERQNKFYKNGKSRLKWPLGKHNVVEPNDLSLAVDAAPFIRGAISWDARHCIYLAGVVCGVGAHMGVRIRWGGDWDMDGEAMTDQDFQDLVHFELIS